MNMEADKNENHMSLRVCQELRESWREMMYVSSSIHSSQVTLLLLRNACSNQS